MTISTLLIWTVLALFALFWGRKHRYFVLPTRALFDVAPNIIHLLLAFLCMFGPTFALLYLISIKPPVSAEQYLEHVLTIQLFSYILNLSGSALLLYTTGSPIRHAILSAPGSPSFTDNAKQALLAFALSIPLVMTLQGVLDGLIQWLLSPPFLLPDQTAVYLLKNSIHYPLPFIEALISIIIFAPIAEELLFRGFLQSFLRRFLSARLAILITALIFALFHFSLTQGLSNIVIVPALFLLACFLGMLYEKQRSLLAPILLHIFFNTFNAIQLYLFE